MALTIHGGSTDVYPLVREELERQGHISGRLLKMKIDGVCRGLCLKAKDGRVYTHPTLFSGLNADSFDNTHISVTTCIPDHLTAHLFPGGPSEGFKWAPSNALASAPLTPLKHIPVDLLMVLMTELMRQDRLCDFYKYSSCERGYLRLRPRDAILIANGRYREFVICSTCLKNSLDAGTLKPEDIALDGRCIPINGPLMVWSKPAHFPTT